MLGGWLAMDAFRAGVHPPMTDRELVFDYTVGALCCLALWLRRRWPVWLAVAMLMPAVLTFSGAIAYLVAVFTVGVHRPGRTVTVHGSPGAGLRVTVRLEAARSLVAVGARGCVPAVGAIGRLTDMLEDHRRGRSTPVDCPVTFDDELRALAGEIVRLELARRWGAFERDVVELGWPAALAALRAELAAELGELDGRGAR